jgi:hypothetical protein
VDCQIFGIEMTYDIGIKEGRDPKTVARDESRVHRLIIPFVGHMEMDEITALLRACDGYLFWDSSIS